MKKQTAIKGLYAIIDTTYVKPENAEGVASAMLSAGARIIQLRCKGSRGTHGVPIRRMGRHGSSEFLSMAKKIQKLCARKKATFIVNDRIDVALMSRADGAHLGQDDFPPEEARRLLGKNSVIGFSTHSLKQALEGERLYKRDIINYISLGPIFKTKTKAGAAPIVGLKTLNRAASAITVPIVAIGGITGKTLPSVMKNGAACAALISELLAASDIKKKTRSLLAIAAAIKRR
ncbi:MAG: thiamine phosphate synthase [Thermodesulfobacteriota bacterium]